MIRRFPREQSFLERTRLRYVNFLHLLSDGKRERASRVPGFVAVFLGQETDVILLLEGEPANAICLTPQRRSVLPIAAVVERAAQESERGDVAFYGAPEAQLCAMFTTVANGALDFPELDATRPGELFSRLEEQRFEGVLEVREGDAVHYLLFDAGTPREAFIAGDPEGALIERLERLFEAERAKGLTLRAYPALSSLPVQAAPALVQLYGRTVAGALDAVREPLGPETAVRLFEEARGRAGARHPALAGYRLETDGSLKGESVADAESLTDAVAAWLLEALTTAHRLEDAIDPAGVLERVTYENRFALEAQGFFRHLPWPVGR